MVNILIRQNRMSEVSKKISEKQVKAASLEEELKEL
jgi:hypothetical protein